jgi:hypothetical protein
MRVLSKLRLMATVPVVFDAMLAAAMAFAVACVFVDGWGAYLGDAVIAIVGMAAASVAAGALMKQVAVRLFHEVGTDSSDSGTAPLFLYLRSFENEVYVGKDSRNQYASCEVNENGHVSPLKGEGCPALGRHRRRWQLEEVLAETLYRYGFLAAVGQRAASSSGIRIQTSDADWQGEVLKLMRQAQVIICVPGNTAGTRWEVDALHRHGWLDKTVFVNPGNCLIEAHAPGAFSSDVYARSKLEDGPYFHPAPPDFWYAIRAAYADFGFPPFSASGEWFMLRSVSPRGVRATASELQKWGAYPELDLLAMLKRRGLLTLSDRHAAKVTKYLSC